MRRFAAAASAALLAASLLAVAAGASAPGAPATVIAAYYASWDQSLSVSQIPATRLTDVIYAFGAIDRHDRCQLGQPRADVGSNPVAPGGNLGALKLLRAAHPGLVTEISIADWSGSQRFSRAASTPARRRAFVSSCISLFLKRWPGVFGGIDLDWEFPVSDGAPSKLPARPADRADATLLLAEFRRQLDQLDTATHRHYLLTAAMPAFSAPGYTPETSWNLGAAAALVDWFNLMTYDMTGRYSPVTGFESPLHATPSGSTPHPPAGANTVDAALALYEGAGVPAAKIVLGAPFYGHLFTHVPGHYNGLFQRFRKLGDTPSYAALAASAPSGLRHWSPYADEPWVYDHRTRTFLSYDDPQAMAAKAAYVLARHLRGAMIWEIGMDTASHSLLNALTAPLLASG